MISPKSPLPILGNVLKGFILAVFALVVICTMVAALGASSLAWAVLTSTMPVLGRVGLFLVLAIAISIVFESFR